MPEISIQQKEGISWWVWLVGLILLALVIWWAIAAFNDRDRTNTPATSSTVTGSATTETEVLPLATILSSPAGYVGRTIQGVATVSSVVTDRGFWVEQNGQRMFAVIDESVGGQSEVADINVGQQLRFQGTVEDTARASQLAGVQNLKPDTRQIIQSQPAFLYMHAWNKEILNR